MALLSIACQIFLRGVLLPPTSRDRHYTLWDVCSIPEMKNIATMYYE